MSATCLQERLFHTNTEVIYFHNPISKYDNVRNNKAVSWLNPKMMPIYLCIVI